MNTDNDNQISEKPSSDCASDFGKDWNETFRIMESDFVLSATNKVNLSIGPGKGTLRVSLGSSASLANLGIGFCILAIGVLGAIVAFRNSDIDTLRKFLQVYSTLIVAAGLVLVMFRIFDGIKSE